MTTIPTSRNSLSSDDELISRITEIRAINNACWMGLLRLAVQHAPQQAKLILTDIQRNDLLISELNGKLAGVEDSGDEANMSDNGRDVWAALDIDFNEPDDPLAFKIVDDEETVILEGTVGKDLIDYFIDGAVAGGTEKIEDDAGKQKAKRIAEALRVQADKLEAVCK